jgi:hypothetical protein
MKRIHFLLLATVMATSVSIAQKTIHVTGRIFEANQGKTVAYVPFASIYYYNYEDSTQLEYFAFTDRSGNYDLGKIVLKKYIVKITAPGYLPRQKKIGNLPAELPKEYQGTNITLHIKLEHDSTQAGVKPIVFQPETLKKSSKDNFWNMVRQIEEIVVDPKAKTFTTRESAPVRVLLNGFNMQSRQLEKIGSLPVAAFEKMEYYDLSDQADALYEGVLNIVLITGETAGKVTFDPIETEKYNIE